jgi:hypothetical protein
MPDDRYFTGRPVVPLDLPSPHRPERMSLLTAHPDLFEASHGRVRCMLCGRSGYDWTCGPDPRHWSRHCIVDHPYVCPDALCGRLFSSRQALSGHVRHAEAGRHITVAPCR